MKRGRPPKKITITYGLVAAWVETWNMTEEELRSNPVTALARRLGIDKSAASRHIARLVQRGLVTRDKGSSRAITVKTPRSGCTIHAHAPDERCRGVENVDLSDTCDRVNFPLASPEEQRGNSIKPFCVFIENGMKKKTTQHIKRLAEVYSVPRKRREANTEEDALLLEAYTARRRRLDPLYEPTRRDLRNMASARRMLLSHNVPKTKFRAYLDFIFERFPLITGGRATFPPTKSVAAEGIIERFASELPPRVLNYKRAASMLSSGGFGDVNSEVVVSIVATALKQGGQIPDGLGDRYSQAVRWLIERISNVGYTDTEGEDNE